MERSSTAASRAPSRHRSSRTLHPNRCRRWSLTAAASRPRARRAAATAVVNAAGEGRCTHRLAARGSTTTSTLAPHAPAVRAAARQTTASSSGSTRGSRPDRRGRHRQVTARSGDTSVLGPPPPAPDPRRHTCRGGVGGARRPDRAAPAQPDRGGVPRGPLVGGARLSDHRVHPGAAHAAPRPQSPGDDPTDVRSPKVAVGRTPRGSPG